MISFITSFKSWLLIVAFSFFNITLINAQCPPPGGPQDGCQGCGGGPGGPGGPGTQWEIPRVHSSDPNDIVGPVGYDTIKRWVSINDKLGYRVRFENNPAFATAPAQNVFVYLPIPPWYNINSMKLGSYGFGSFTFQVPDNTSFYSTRLDVRDSLGLFIDFTAGIDVIQNRLFWIFRSIDPATGQAPTNAQSGFLPVNDTSINRFNDTLPKAGEGYVTFLINAKNTLQTGDTVSGKATIIFDTNEEIPTNYWTNTIDAVSPTSAITMATVQSDTVRLYWAGSDDPGGSGIRDYSLYVSENNGPFLLYKNKIKAISELFVGTPGNRYCFFTLATDNTGNIEALKNSGFTCVQLGNGVILPVNWLYFRGRQAGEDVLLNWATAKEVNTKFYDVERSFNGTLFTKIGSVNAAGNTNVTNLYTFTDKDAINSGAKTLYYRLRQIDVNGKFTYSNIVIIPLNNSLLIASVKVYPNPFNQALTVLINSVQTPKPSDILEIFTVDGKLVYTKNLAARQNNVPLILSDLSSTLKAGTYILKTNLNGTVESIKIIKQ